jgi:hypothetical protein
LIERAWAEETYKEVGVARVYICHPFSSNPRKNRSVVARLARRLALLDYLPIAPQICLPAFIDEATERDLALNLCLAMVALADQVRVYGEPTAGMRLEIAEARRLGIPVLDGETGELIPNNGEPPR